MENQYNIRRYANPEIKSGVLFVAGLEGHKEHRAAIQEMSLFARPIILFEQDEYLTSKEREAPFLPLEVRLSMWSYYGPNLILSVSPKIQEGTSQKEHYQRLFDTTEADYCFATEGDPKADEKKS